MVKYYFFKVCREINAQRQRRTVLHPLPGQTTYETARNPQNEVDPTYKVQLSSEENSKVVRLPADAIIGVAYEGASLRSVKLNVYSRNDVKFYRTENEVFLVEGLSLSSTIRNADDDMIRAYRELVGRDGAESAERSTSSTAAADDRHNGPLSGVTADSSHVTRIDTAELDSIESSLLDDFNEREALGKLLIISQIRDRMRLGVAKFCYTKQNGDQRVAYGTRNIDVIRQCGGEGNTERPSIERDGRHFCYFDVQRGGWRSFCTEDIQSVTSDMPITSMSTIREIAAQPVR